MPFHAPFGSSATDAPADKHAIKTPSDDEATNKVKSIAKGDSTVTPVLERLPILELPPKHGVVTEIDPGTEQKGMLPAGVQLPAPKQLGQADKREYAPLVKAMQGILEGRHEEGIEHLRVYDERTQEFFIRLLPTLSIFVRKGIDDLSPQEVAVLNNQLYGLLATLRPRSELVVEKMCCCKSIQGFGAYEPLPEQHAFRAASKERPGEFVQLYVELKNFASEAIKEGEYLTKLACTLEIHNTKGEIVWTHTYDRAQTTHPRHTRLNDFYSNYSFYVPALAPGNYRLTVQITDETMPELQKRVARRAVDFRVTSVAAHATLK